MDSEKEPLLTTSETKTSNEEIVTPSEKQTKKETSQQDKQEQDERIKQSLTDFQENRKNFREKLQTQVDNFATKLDEQKQAENLERENEELNRKKKDSLENLEMESEELNKEKENLKSLEMEDEKLNKKGDNRENLKTETSEETDADTEKSDLEQKENEIVDYETALNTAREEYFQIYRDSLKGGRINELRIKLGLKPKVKEGNYLILAKAEKAYTQAKIAYAKNEYKQYKQDVKEVETLSAEEQKKLIAEGRNSIFQEVILDEITKLQQNRIDTLSTRNKGIFMKAYEQWTQRYSKKERLIYSTIMVVGVAGLASLATPVSASAAALGLGAVAGRKLVRGGFGMFASTFAGKLFDKKAQQQKENFAQQKEEAQQQAKESFNFDNLTVVEGQMNKILTTEKKQQRNLLLKKALVMAGVGAGASVGLGLLDNFLTPEASLATEGSDSGGEPKHYEIPQRPEAPANSEEVTATKPGDSETVETSKEETSTMPEENTSSPQPETPPENAPLSTKITPENTQATVKAGDSIWEIAKNQLQNIYGDKFKELSPAQQTYLIDTIKDKVVADSQSFNLTDADKIQVGQQLNLQQAYANIDDAFAEAKGLSGEQQDSISNFSPAESQESRYPLADGTTPEENISTAISEEIKEIQTNIEKIDNDFQENLKTYQGKEEILDNTQKDLANLRTETDQFYADNPNNHEEWQNLNEEIDQQEQALKSVQEQQLQLKENLLQQRKQMDLLFSEALQKGLPDKAVEISLKSAQMASLAGENPQEIAEYFKTAMDTVVKHVGEPQQQLTLFRKILGEIRTEYEPKDYLQIDKNLLEKIENLKKEHNFR